MIQGLLADGYAPVEIKEMLHTTYYRIRRYATGDPGKLCRFGTERPTEAERYRNDILTLLERNTPFNRALEVVSAKGYGGKRTAFETYCRKLITETGLTYTPKRNAVGAHIVTKPSHPARRYVSRTEYLKHLWSGKEFDSGDAAYIASQYPITQEIQQCVRDFRRIYAEKCPALLDAFIEQYAVCASKPIRAFVSGLRIDLDAAVRNSVTSDLSNGFVEGTNNKIKAIKRMMYGRAKIDLLRIKALFAR